MRQQRPRRSRSWSKKSRRRPVGQSRTPCRRASIFAFAGGVALAVFLWSRLQRNGVPGPWARLRDLNLLLLRKRRDYLLDQIAALDKKLADPRPDVKGWDNEPLRPASGGKTDPEGESKGVEAEGHYILGLSAAEFASTPMMASYDTQVCEESFGNGLVDAWREKRTECCPRSGDGYDSSSIRCHLMHQKDHRGGGDNLVQMRNVQVDLSYFHDEGVAKGVMAAYKRTKHEDQAYIHLPKGAVKGTCTPDPSSWQGSAFPGWNADWTSKAFQHVEDLECDEWVEHPVMVVQRDTFANLFHDSEDFVNAFLAMAILRKPPGDTEVWLTDLYPKGPFWPMWERVFGVGRPTLTAWEAGRRYSQRKTCFRDLTVGIYGPAAPTTLARFVTPCFHTGLVKAYSDFVIREEALPCRGNRYASPPSKKVVVTWMARRSSVQASWDFEDSLWPERAFCSEDGKDSFFTCEYFSHLDTRELQRKVKNEAEVLASLRTLQEETFGNGAEVEIRDVDYNLLSFEDQIRNDLETDVMIGPHGAGLYHIIFTPDRASLIELQIDQTMQRKHFANLARWSGHGYTSKGGPNPVVVDATTSMVREAITRMDLAKH
ncbi:unnamed protein product [Ascophyllum nodosum]